MTIKIAPKTTRHILQWLTHVGSLLPLALLLWDFWVGQLGPNPIQALTIRTGDTAVTLLLLSLAVTPLNIIFGWKQILPLRKPLGLYAFLYVVVHFLIFTWLDYGLNLALIVDEVVNKRFALVGFTAFLLLIPLAATSTRWAMRKLGKNWKRLHQMVYFIGILAIIHYLWAVKTVTTKPFVFTIILVLLLVVRIKPVKQAIISLRRNWEKRAVRQASSTI
ncbi:MAG: sulfoxide reductase heme-binding subunit YedZ [Anaerolineales bacterium]|nr:sulfoxide reductase heme-binding subunit YedZ [Anaerolineales bacterium]